MSLHANVPPGPNRNLLLCPQQMHSLRSDFLGFLTAGTETHGPVWSFKVGPESACVINAPELVHEILATRAEEFVRAASLKRLFGRIMGNGLTLSDGEFWRTQRRLAQPAFHFQRIAGYLAAMYTITQKHVERWEPDTCLDFDEAMTALTLEIVAITLLGSQPPAEKDKLCIAVAGTQKAVSRLLKLGIPLPAWLPTPDNLRLSRSTRIINSVILPIISERRKSGRDHGDLLSMFLKAVDSDDPNRHMSDEQVRDEVVTMFLAGHDTTANLLTWTVFLLCEHPDVLTRLQNEVDDVLGGKAPQLQDLQRLTYAEMVLRESMRLYPPVYILLREPIEDLVVGGYLLKKGQMILLCAWMLQRDPQNFEQPESFNPERFRDGIPRGVPRGAYIPFGAGPHLCIGKEFAMVEALIILSSILQQFTPRLAAGQIVEPDPLITLRPRNGLKVILTRRTPC